MPDQPLRPELPPLPDRIAKLPRHRGYPVPWFVAWVGGVPEFRVIGKGKVATAVRERRCWVCGETLGARFAFVIGPMCAVNRISSEPPSHLDCAEFSARACPFLSRPHMVRREGGLPAAACPAAGFSIDRNPGVALVWVARDYRLIPTPDGRVLFRMGAPLRVSAYAEGRTATPEEIAASVDSGLPFLQRLAEGDGPDAVQELERMAAAARRLLRIPVEGRAG